MVEALRTPEERFVGLPDFPFDAALAAQLLEQLDLRGVTVVVHDWGGPIGLRLAVEHPDRIDRIVVTDTDLFTGHQRMTPAWEAFRDFVARTEDLPIGTLVRGGCHRDPGDAVVAAYDAPFAGLGSFENSPEARSPRSR